MEELADSLVLYNFAEEKGMSVDIIRTAPKKYRILIDVLGPDDCPPINNKFWTIGANDQCL